MKRLKAKGETKMIRWLHFILSTLFHIALCFALIFTLSCCHVNTDKEIEEIVDMFDGFNNASGAILLTCNQLVVDGVHYDLNDIQYKEQRSNIVFLEENGFYSYIYDRETLTVEFLFTYYENFETTVLGTAVLPSGIITDFFADRCFWFRMDDPQVDKFKQIYFSWNIDTAQAEVKDTNTVPDNYESAQDNHRSANYSFHYKSRPYFGQSLYITNNETGVTKRISKTMLNQFEEGKKIKQIHAETVFNIDKVFEKDDDIYLSSLLGVGFLGYPCYYYIVKWNFETEEFQYYTAVYFEEYQDWLDDLYIR